METWFWILGWVLSFLTIIGNGFTIFLVCSRRNLRTKTNAFIVSLAVADFCVGLSVIPSLFFCEITNTCYWPQSSMSWVFFTRLLVSNTSAVNLCGLVLDRFIAIVHSLKYISFMTRRRIFRIIFFSWVLVVSYNILQFLILIICKTAILIFLWLHLIFFEFLPCVVLISCFVSVIFHVRRHDRSARTLAKQLRFNHQMSFKSHHKKSAVVLMGIVIGVFLVCYGIYLRCSLVVLSDTNASCNDEQYKLPFLVLNSAINPISYAFFKSDIKKEFRKLIGHCFFKKKDHELRVVAGLDSFGAGKDVAVGLKSSWNLEILMSKQEKRKNQRTHENT